MSNNSTERKEASAVIWNWKTLDLSSDAGPDAGSLRRKGVIQGLTALFVAWVFSYFDLTVMSYIAFFLGCLFISTALFSPDGVFAVLDRAGHKLGVFLSGIINWILMPLIYFGFFLPFKVLLRRGSKDTLKRFYNAECASYWIERDQSALAPGTRRHQF